MGPGPDGEAGRAAGGPQGLVVGHLGGQEEVVPAADQAGRRDLPQPAPEVDRVPPGVPGGAVLEPVLVGGRRPPDRRHVAVPEGQHVGGGRQHPDAAQLGAQDGAPAELLVLDLVDPGQCHLEREGAARVHDGVADVRRRDLERQRLDEVRRVLRDRPLRHAEVAPAPHDEAAVEPRLRRHPLQRRMAVGLLVADGIPFPLGPERPPAALDHHLVATLGIQPSERADDVPPVRRADQHGRPATRSLGGEPAVGQQDGAVGHLGRQVALDRDIGGVGRGELDQRRCHPAPHGHVDPLCSPSAVSGCPVPG